MTLFHTAKAFKALARAKRNTATVLVAKDSIVGPTLSNDRTIDFVISTEAVDRDDDIIKQDGWKLQNYQRNAVVLLNHDTSSLPIGKAVKITTGRNELRASVEFVPADVPLVGPVAEAVYRLCTGGFMCATSVGFRPLDWEWRDDDSNGVVFRQQELLEFSIVTVPSNPEALIDAPKALDELVTAALPDALLNRRSSEYLTLRSRLLDLEDTF